MLTRLVNSGSCHGLEGVFHRFGRLPSIRRRPESFSINYIMVIKARTVMRSAGLRVGQAAENFHRYIAESARDTGMEHRVRLLREPESESEGESDGERRVEREPGQEDELAEASQHRAQHGMRRQEEEESAREIGHAASELRRRGARVYLPEPELDFDNPAALIPPRAAAQVAETREAVQLFVMQILS